MIIDKYVLNVYISVYNNCIHKKDTPIYNSYILLQVPIIYLGPELNDVIYVCFDEA